MTEGPRSEKWKQELGRNFLAAYEEHASALFRHILIRVRDRETAMDMTQESFTKTWLYLSQGKTIEYMRAFLFRVANNLIVDLSRKKKTSSLDMLMDDDGFEPADEHATDFLLLPEAQEAKKYMDSLDEIYRSALRLRFFENLSLGEIALKFGISENVVSVRIHRGIAQLKRILQEKTKGP